MDPDSAWALLAAERRAFANVLDSLSTEQWEAQSLCGHWTVREVATHMMVGPTGSLAGFMTAMVRARGRFEVANRVMVDRRSARPTQQIADDLRLHADHRFAPPTMDWHAPLTDFLLHRLDITVPLGLPSGGSSQAWPDALGFLVGPKARTGFTDAGMPALSLAATDVDWSHGSGAQASGPAEVLALALTRRPVRLDELDGPGAPVLRDWAARRAG